MRDPCAKLLWIGVLLLLLVGCIRPIEETPTPTPGGPGITTQPTNTTAPLRTPPPVGTLIDQQDYPIIEDYLLRVGKSVSPNTLEHWHAFTVGSEIVVGVDFLNPSGLPCTGAVISRRELTGALNVYNGEATCASEPSAAAIAGNWFVIAWETGNPLTITAAQIFSAPVTEVVINYEDGQALRTSEIIEGHVLYVRNNSVLATQVQFINQSGVAEYIVPIVH